MALLLILLATLILWIKASSLTRVREVQQGFARMQTEGFYLGIHISAGIHKLNGLLVRCQLSPDSVECEAFHGEARDVSARIAANAALLSTPEERRLAVAVQSAFEKYLVETAPLLEQPLRPLKRDSIGPVFQQVLSKSEAALKLTDELIAIQHAALAGSFSAAEDALGSLHTLMWVSTLLMLALAAAVAVLAYGLVVTPLRAKLTQSRAAMAGQERLASLGTLAAGVAHEIRNPLTAIKFRLFSFKKELPPAIAQHEDLRVIGSEVARLEKIVQDFLQFARPSQPELTQLTSQEIVQDVWNLLKNSLLKQEIELRLEVIEVVTLRADKQQVQQTLINLVRNAAESIERQGTIWLRTRAGVANLGKSATPVAIFEVTDTGKGIPQEIQGNVFDPFYSSKEGGTGLGLPIAARIAENHGGYLHFHSEPERGTTFSLVLPRIIDHATTNTAH
jgi:signal transduction histidine kinase